MKVKTSLALITIAASVAASTSTASNTPKLGPSLPTLIAETEVALWRCQDQRQIPRTQYSKSPWSLPRSHAYRKWTLALWTQRRKVCIIELHSHDAELRRLRIGLTSTPMAGSERELLRAGLHWHIAPEFIAAIAGTESSFGAAACSNNRYNAFGLSSCGAGWHVPPFQSWKEAYEFMGRFLTSRWPNARTTYDYHGYAACSSCWGAKTESQMRRFGVNNSVRF